MNQRIEQIKARLKQDIEAVLNDRQKAAFEGLLNELFERLRPPFARGARIPDQEQNRRTPFPWD